MVLSRNYISPRSVINFRNSIKVCACACGGGTLEKQGPLGSYLDIYCPDDKTTDSWEKNESDMVKQVFSCALSKLGISESSIDIILGGDLMNQCTGTAYGLSSFDAPYLGLYGACSTFAEGIMIASMLIDSGHINTAAVAVSSHFCTAERQYRFPLEYGSFPAPTAQNTVTGCGVMILSRADEKDGGVFIRKALPGIVIDRGIDDAANMGAAMATAAADTTLRFLQGTNANLSDYDIIATGDLGSVGHAMEKDMLKEKGVTDKVGILCDCGTMIYDIENQSAGCGGSGCGCSAVVTCGYIFDALSKNKMKNAAIIGTGAMMSPQSLLQGLSIPSVAHLVTFEKV